MMPPPSDPYSFQKEISEYYYGEIDAKFANNPRFNAIDITLVRDFFNSLGYIGYGTTMMAMGEGIKKFIDYLEKRKGKTSENIDKRRPAESGVLRIYKEGPRNVIFMEGEGKPAPILEACELRPLFQIQTGYILALKNVKIQYKGSHKGLILEMAGPSFVFDPDDVKIEKVDVCSKLGEAFIINDTIWVGDPKRAPKREKGGY